MLSVLSSALVRLDAPGVTGGEHDRLLECLADVPDPRDRRGIRHELASVLAVAACAVLAGARSLVAIAEWAADASQQVLAALGSRQCVRTGARIAPSEATTRRVAQLADGDALDAALGRWLRRGDDVAACAGAAGGWAALAADGKTVRGARQAGGKAPHLLAALTADGVVWAQRQVDVKSNEINALQPLLSDVDITGMVFTADAMHTHASAATWLVEAKQAHYLLPVKENQPTLFWGFDALPWSGVPKHACAERGHGRNEQRTIQVTPMPEHLRFPYAAQVALIERYVSDLDGNQRSAAAVFYLTDLTPAQAGPTELATLAPPALGDRESAALGPRRHLRRGRQPDTHRQRSQSDGQPEKPGNQHPTQSRPDQHRTRPAPPRTSPSTPAHPPSSEPGTLMNYRL